MPRKAAPTTRSRTDGPRVLDLRSDTVTQPTDAMRHAMAMAEVGDDVYGEDPTVQRLQEKAARLVGMEAALFVPTGTMGNQIAVWVHARSSALVCEENCHLSLYEGGAAALLSNVSLKTVAATQGTFTAQDMQRFFLPRDPHFSQVKAVAIENTHNFSGGRTWSAAQTKAIADLAHAKGASLHVDGARIFNAAIARKTTAASLCKPADSVMFCLSKGLSAPVGSLVCGSKEFIGQARFVRKTLGGGMRQAGHIAAAGLVALDTGIDRLAEDHRNAKLLAKGLADLPGIRVDPKSVETNMVMADVSGTGMDAADFIAACKKEGVLIGARGADPVVRFVTHRNVSEADCKEAVERLTTMFARAN
ncbi:MAG TPA: GntG family PLP-dependent aldolase [Candidatus Thermoplasmatota archaeon]|nr:GntG family PLP-dependent aldolase [Candidatus Thermoplasmatota archaeon]